MKKMALLLLCAAAVCLFAGCGNNETAVTENSVLYNHSGLSYADSNRYLFIVNGAHTVCYDKQTWQKSALPKDAFFDPDDENAVAYAVTDIFSDGGTAYYLRNTPSNSIISSQTVHALDLTTFHDRTLYTQTETYYRTVFLGLSSVLSTPADTTDDDFSQTANVNNAADDSINGLFPVGDDLYLVKNDSVERWNRSTGTVSTVIDGVKNGAVASDGAFIYYVDTEYRLVRYSLRTGKTVSTAKIYTQTFLVTKNSIVYANMSDGNKLYAAEKSGTNPTKLSDDPARNLSFDDDFIYYLADNSLNRFYRIRYDGSGRTALPEKLAGGVGVCGNLNQLLVEKVDAAGQASYYLMDKQTFALKALS